MSAALDLVVVGAGPAESPQPRWLPRRGSGSACWTTIPRREARSGEVSALKPRQISPRQNVSQLDGPAEGFAMRGAVGLAGGGRARAGRLRLECGIESCDLRFERLIVATGARERFLPFPGWTLPGVMAPAVCRRWSRRARPARKASDCCGQRASAAGCGGGLARAGATIAGIYEQASMAQVAASACTRCSPSPEKSPRVRTTG